jgi:hypothetical protein
LLGMELGTIELVDCFLIIIIHCFTLKMLTLRIKVFLALTELLLCNLVFCRHSFLCLIIRFLLSQPLFNLSNPIILIMLLLFMSLINFKTRTSCIYINSRIGDNLFLLVLLARIPSMLHYFKLFYFSLFGISMRELSCRWWHKLVSPWWASPTFHNFLSDLL